jgi:hypothetical protein
VDAIVPSHRIIEQNNIIIDIPSRVDSNAIYHHYFGAAARLAPEYITRNETFVPHSGI